MQEYKHNSNISFYMHQYLSLIHKALQQIPLIILHLN